LNPNICRINFRNEKTGAKENGHCVGGKLDPEIDACIHANQNSVQN